MQNVSCELFLKNGGKKPYDGIEPSLFGNFTFLLKQTCITSEESKQLKKYLSKVRKNNLRNHTTHGSNNIITQKDVDTSINAFFKLQETFEKIMTRISKMQ